MMWAKIGGILAAVLLVFGLGYHFGSLAPKLAAAKAEVKQDEAQDAKRLTDQTTVAQEAKSYEAAALEPIPAPVVRLCVSAPSVSMPSANPARSGTHANATVEPANPLPPVPGPDIGPSLMRAAAIAESQVIELQDYVTKVCQAHVP